MNKYIELIQQTFDFPQEEFSVKQGELYFHGIRMMDLVEKQGSPLKFSYLPKISERIQYAKEIFGNAIKKLDYSGSYQYAYCTKSSHFAHVLEEVLKNDIHIETSSAYDMAIVQALMSDNKISKNTFIICNGFKRKLYVDTMCELVNDGFNCIPVLDNITEFDEIKSRVTKSCNLGIRVAADEEPNFDFYTSRLGIAYNQIVPFYKDELKNNPNYKLKMLHYFINTGIRDTSYYWNELSKFVENIVN